MLKRGGLIVIGLLCLWQFLVWIFQLPDFLLPSPIQVFQIFLNNPHLLLQEALPTIFESIIGFFLAAFWGIIVAILMRLSRAIQYWTLPILILSQAIPTFAVAPFFVIWFGYGMSSKVAVTLFALFFPITIAFYDGLRRTKRGWLDLAKVMKSKRLNQLWYLEIPSALPALGSGLRVSAAWAPMSAVIGEWVGSSKGLGFLILNANSKADTSLMFAALFVLVVFAMTLYFAVDLLLKRYIYWEKE